MSTQSAINLLKTYNKNNPYAKSQSTAPQSDKKFGTWSYANKYDALYNQYSGNKNFNINMWREAIKLGEQDQYFAFLEQNKDKTLSAQFYDPQFYDYESMMMEMFLPFADNTNREKYTQEVFNNETQTWEVRDLGELTQREYYDYLIKNTRELQRQKITRDLEQWRKDQLGFWGQLGADIGATAAEFGEGILSALAGLSDFVIATGSLGFVPWAMDRESNYLDAFVNYFGQHGLTAAEKNTVRAALDEFERTHSHFRDIDGNMTGVGKYIAGISNSIGMMIPAIVANFATGGAAMVGTATFYASIFSTNLYENANDPNRVTSPSWVKLTNAAVKSGVEAVIEYGLGKLLGGTIQNNLLGLSGKLKAGAINLTKTSGWKYLLKSAGQEGLEEFLQDFSTNLADQFYGMWYEGYCNTGVTFQTLVDSLCIGFLSSLVMSGGRVGIDSGRSAIQNAIAKKKGTYNNDLDVGPGDMVIEKDGKVEKITGLNRLYFGSILSDFRGAIDALKKGSINIKKDLRNAQEIYSAISTISQFYASFDAERIKMCELLLDRVVKAEKQTNEKQKVDERAKSILAPETVNAIEKSTKRTDVKAAAKSFATVVELTLNEMINTNAIASRLKNIRTVADAVGADLEAGGVTKINTVTDADGIVHKNTKSTRIKNLEDELGKKGMETYEELRKKYEYVVTTDGHIICERDGFVFVSEAWLKNYSGSDLDYFLEQTHVIKSLADDKTLRPMFDELYKFVKEFTGQEMSYEDTIMQFLFNESVYQAFLLSQKTDAVHKYKDFIFSLYDRFDAIAKDSKYYQQVFGKDRKPAKPRQEMLKEILRKIQNTMRRPTVKAILNWGFVPQTIGADSILSPEDKRFIQMYKTHHAVLAGGKGPGGKSAYENLVEDLIAGGYFNDKELALIRKSRDGTATIDEDIEARALLDEADRRLTRYDFEVSPNHSFFLVSADRLTARLKSVDFTKVSESYSDGKRQTISSLVEDINWYVQEAIADAPGYMDSRNLGSEAGVVDRAVERIKETLEEYKYDTSKNHDIEYLVDQLGDDGSLETLDEDVGELVRLLTTSLDTTDETPYDVAMTQLREIIDDIESFVNEIRGRTNVPEKLRDRINFWYERSFESGLINTGAGVDLNLIAMSGIQLMRDYCAHVEKTSVEHRKKVGLGAFIVPYQVAGFALGDKFATDAQFVTDKLDEFKNMYGISARQMIMGDLTGMSMDERNQLTQDMEILEVDNIVLFVIKKLEGMLGDKYVVTPTNLQLNPDGDAFTVVANPTFNESKDWARLSKRLETDRNRVTQWFEKHKNAVGAKESRASTLIEEFHEYTTTLQPSKYSDFNEFLTDENKAFWKELGRLYRNQSASSAFKYILSNKDLILAQFDAVARVLSQSASEASKDHNDTHIYDFAIARAIPAEAFLSHDILAEDIDARNAIFKQIFQTLPKSEDLFRQIFDEVSEYKSHYDKLPDHMKERFSREEIDYMYNEMEIMSIRVEEAGEDPNVVYKEFIDTIARGVNPFTGEVFYEIVTSPLDALFGGPHFEYDATQANDPLFAELFHFDLARDIKPYVPLSKFIDTSKFPGPSLDNVMIYLEDAGEDSAGYASGNTIVIDPVKDSDHFGTLVHEINHILQHRNNMPNGFSSATARAMPDFLAYVMNHYPNYVKYTFRRCGYDDNIEILYGEDGDAHITGERLREIPAQTYRLIAYCGYSLVQGELWARAYTHNGKPVHGFAEIVTTDGNYLLAPDGKTKFEVVHDTSDTKVMNATAPEMTPAVAEAVLSTDAQLVLNMMRLKDSSMYVRDTFHAMNPNAKPAFELNKLILRDGLPVHRRLVNLDAIIRNPQEYLSDEVLEACHGDFRVGNVLHRVKEFIEDNTDGVSIDVLRDGTFVYVSDYEFNDFLATDLKARAKSDKETLVKKYETIQQEILDGTTSRDDLMLEDFYDPRILSFVESCTVALRRDAGGSHTTRDGITIQIYDGMTDAQFVKELNHELRHYIQYRQGFVVGTDVNFDLPDEAIVEMKKHLPEYFKNTELRKVAERSLAKNPARARSVDELLAKLYVYYFTSGEMMAYAIDSGFLHTQPIIMNRISDDKGTFAFEWYDKNTGEGRWTVTFYDEAKRAAQVAAKKSIESKTSTEGKKPTRGKKSTEGKKSTDEKKPTKKKKTKNDDDEAPLTEKRIRRPRAAKDAEPLPFPEIEGKAETKEVTYEDTGEGKKGKKIRKYKYKNNRHFTKASAEGTNLMNFYRPGEQNQMAPELQAFIKDTTGHLDQLPPELAKAIAPGGKRKGYLTEQALFKWFRNVKAENVNQFTFDLIKKHFFNDNPYITDMESLDELTNMTNLSFYWAIIPVLRAKGLDHDVKFNENTVDKLKAFFNTQMSRAEQRQVEELQTAYEKIWVTDKSGALSYESGVFDERLSQYARVMVMKWFDGTITGAFYAANNARTILRAHEEELRNKIDSTNKKISEDKDGNSQDIEDTMGTRDRENDDEAGAEEDQVLRAIRSTGNDLIAIYEEELADSLLNDASADEMIEALTDAYVDRLIDKNNFDRSALTKKQQEWLAKKALEYREKADRASFESLSAQYAKLMNAKLTGVNNDIDIDSKKDAAKNRRVNIVKRIKSKAKTLLKYVSEGKVAFAQLPDEVQALFERTSAKTEKGKMIEGYVLKESAYSVGRGRARIEKETDRGRIDYAEKHNIVEGNDVFKHDVTEILKNDALLRDTLKQVRWFIAHKDNTIKKATKTTQKNALAMSERIAKWSTDTTKGEGNYNTEFKVRKNKNSVSDTPTVFNISSNVDMPKPLYSILSTSFTKFADTMVQFVSVDEKTGKVYDKAEFPKKKDFDSLVQHEVVSWDLFYEVNQDMLLNFSRDDVLDIIKFFAEGSGTINGPMNKYGAFTVFLLGFFVDGARRNFNGWDFSADEIKMIERLYEDVASYFGSGLKAVQQMLKVVNPMKKLRSRMFNDWEAITEEDTDALIKATDELNMMKDKKAREEQAKVITTMLNDFAEKQKAYERTNLPRWSKAWWRRQWSKVKSWRYMSMLSGPATWVRNSLSNVIVTGLNATADQVSRLIFIPKKGYREDQWDLPGTKISDDVKAFIDTYIGKRGDKNPLFDDLYNVQTKYDSAAKAKIKHEKNLLAELIAEAWVKKYAADNRFDSKGFKLISKFVDARISDGRFVKFASRRYFGKILTIEVERGNVSLSNGFDSKVMTLFAESILLANQEYMHKRSAVANMLDNIRERYPQLHEALTFWQPFINSSFNWWQETLKYTPVGLALAINKMVKLEKQITILDERRAKGERAPDSRFVEFLARRDIGKGTLGLLLSMMGVWLAISGMVRIEEDDDKFYLYCADNVKLDITQVFGSSSLLLGSAVAQHWIKQSDGEVASLEEMFTMITNVTMNGFFAADLLERYKWGSLYDNALREGESMFKSFVPQLWQTIIACTNEQGIRYSSGFMGSFERVLNSFVPTQPMGTRKINPYTGEIEDKYAAVLPPVVGPLLQKGIIGPKIYWVDVSKQEKLAKEYQVNRAELTGQLTVNGKKYELDRLALNQKYGELNKKSLAQVTSQRHKVQMEDGSYKTLHWNQLNAKQRENVITNIMNKNADYAKIYMWTQELKHKYYASESVWTTLRQMGLARNVYKGDKGFVE